MSTEPAPKAKRRRVGTVVASVLGLVLLWTATQTVMCVSRYDQEMRHGADALLVQDWAGARAHFREAASARLMDDVAVYGLYVAERIESTPDLNAFEGALKRGDLMAARKACDSESDPARRAVQLKLLDGLTRNAE